MDNITRRGFLALTGATGLAASARGSESPAQQSNKDIAGLQGEDTALTSSADPSAELRSVCAAAPSVVGVNEPFTIGIRVLIDPYTAPLNCFTEHYPTVSGSLNISPRGIQYMDNVPPEWGGRVRVEMDAACDGPTEISFADSIGPYPHDKRPIRRVGPYSVSKPGVYYFTFTDPESGATGVSNPVQVMASAPKDRIFWGDIHGHTSFTDGIRSPEEYYYFARDEAFLDFCALTEHAEFYLTPAIWDFFTRVTNDFNVPGKFATLVAQEWTNGPYGHHNLYYKSAAAPMVRATDPAYAELETIYKLAHEHGALVIPHHPASAAMGVNWTLGHDPEVERLVEIYSIWGNSERAAAAGNHRPISEGFMGEKDGQHVVDALKLGRRYGIIASGDIHDGRPGDAISHHQPEVESYRYLQPGGLVGIYASELTREAVFDALWNRRVFGTTGPRMLIHFQIGDTPMGSELAGGDTQDVRIEAHTEAPIARVDLVRNGEDFQHWTPGSGDFEVTAEIPPASEEDSYYVRITREDGEMGWSSPIWRTG